MKTDCKNYTPECEKVYCNECGKWKDRLELMPYTDFASMVGDVFEPEQIARLYAIYEMIMRQVGREINNENIF